MERQLMKRYNSVYAGSYTKPHEMVEEKDGDWVWYEDVETLEAKCAELEAKCAELIQAGEPLVERWHTPMWKWDKHTGTLIYRLRAAIDKAQQEVEP